MKVVIVRSMLAAAVVALVMVDWACGKAPAAPTATPSPVAQATPTPPPPPPPTPAPTPDPQSGLSPGPVASVKLGFHMVEIGRGSGNYRTPAKDAQEVFTLYVGVWIVLDSTQRNAAGQICRWRRDPEYFWDNFDNALDIRQSDDPFFFKFFVARPGVAQVTSRIDGIESNDLLIKAMVKQK